MKYLIGGDRKVLRKGMYVKADESIGEFIWDDDTIGELAGLTVDVLKSICRQNAIPMGKNANKKDLMSKLTKILTTLEVPEQNTMSQSDIIKSVVSTAGGERVEGSDPDAFEVDVFTQCIQRLNKEGITFKIKQLGNLVKKEIAEQGFILTSAQRKEQINAILEEGEFAPEEWAEVEAMSLVLIQKVGDTDGKTALGAMRRFLKSKELEMPKREKKARESFRQRVINFMVDNSPASDEALLEFVTEAKRPDPEKVVERLGGLRDTINQAFAAGVKSTSDEPEEAKAA